MTVHIETIEVQGRTITLETGRIAKQSGGAVLVSCEGSAVLVAANIDSKPKNLPFLPLTCEYRPRFYASGKIPGSFFRRESRPSELGILVARLMDRPTRPLFPKGFTHESQIYAMVVSDDTQVQTDILAMLGTSAALVVSNAPFAGPYGACRVGRVDGEFVLNPTRAQSEESDIDLIVAATADAITMVEGGAKGVDEQVLLDALEFAQASIQPMLDAQLNMRAAVGREKMEFTSPATDESVWEKVKTVGLPAFEANYGAPGKAGRGEAMRNAKAAIAEAFADADEDTQAAAADLVYKLEKFALRNLLLDNGTRADGRKPGEVRNISIEMGVLPRTHGSALFTRGETQALVTSTLGTRQDEQKFDEVWGASYRKFILHYNFPSFSVGEVRRITGPGRREIGHGALARRAVEPTVPAHDDFPYTIRVVSDITESNGSSSMATICGASLAMMDTGVPVTDMVAGIAMGLVKEGDRYQVLTDITGTEDHLGDMDFKVAGTDSGVTALQMDNKVGGITRAVLEEALEQARLGRIHILGKMREAMPEPRAELSAYAPRITSIKINPDKIRDVIGPGGKTIRGLVDETGAKIDVEDDGTVRVTSADGEAAERAIKMIKQLTQEAEIGKLYLGMVRKVTDFGAFVEIFPGTDGLVHISQLAHGRVNRVTDVVNEGDEVLVRCIDIDGKSGKIRLSRVAALGDAN